MNPESAWKFEDAVPCLRRFANAVLSGGIDAVSSDQLARQAVRSVLAQKHPVLDAGRLRVSLYQTMLKLCFEVESAGHHADTVAFLPPSAVARSLYSLSQDERNAIVLTSVEQFSHKNAANVLELPVWVFMARLTRARENLQADLSRQRKKQPQTRVTGTHLRVVK